MPTHYNHVGRHGLFSNRRMMLVQAAPYASALVATRVPPQLLWPLNWPRHYKDGDPTPFRSTFYPPQDAAFHELVRAQKAAQVHMHATSFRYAGRRLERASPKLTAVWKDHAAVVVELTLDNLFHTLFHALPLREDLLDLHAPLLRTLSRILGTGMRRAENMEVGGAAVDFLPRYTVLWPGSPNVGDWLGWELAMRAISGSVGFRTPGMNETNVIVEPLKLRCYPLLLSGHSPFWPFLHHDAPAAIQDRDARGLVAVHQRVVALRRALWRSIRGRSGRGVVGTLLATTDFLPPANPDLPLILFAERSASVAVRTITNFAEVQAAIHEHPRLRGQVRYIRLESLTLSEQLAAVSAVRVLVGMHGMGMAWISMMATDQSTGHAALEIFPQQMRGSELTLGWTIGAGLS